MKYYLKNDQACLAGKELCLKLQASSFFLTTVLLPEQISGLPYGTYLQQNVFDPLEMRHSYTSAPDAAGDGLALGYYPYFGIPARSNLPYREDFLSAYSIIFSQVSRYC